VDNLLATPETPSPHAVPESSPSRGAEIAAEIWDRARATFQAEFPSGAYGAWFAHARGVAFDGTCFTIEVPSSFAQGWLRERYQVAIEETLAGLVGGPVTLEIAIALTPPQRSPSAGGALVDGDAVAAAVAARDAERAIADAERADAVAIAHVHRTILLNPRCTFDAFVVGRSNEFAHAAANAVAERPGVAYNPLFIYGGVGLGKTHLVQSIGHAVLERDPRKRVYYLSAEAWLNEMVSAIQNNATLAFKEKYRTADYFLLDDIQFLSGKVSTQLELFHTFNALHDARKQIVLTSDRPPHEIAELEERLVSRFQGGLVVDIQSPDLETRLAILRKRATGEGIAVEDDVTLLIANSVKNNVRELEGSLVRLLAYASLTGRDITLDLARQVLRDYLSQPSRKVTVDQIQGAVIEFFSLPSDAMRSRRRTAALAHPRQIAMYLVRQMAGLSLTEIGRKFGGRDHTTVLHACEKIRSDVERDPSLAEAITRLRKMIEG